MLEPEIHLILDRLSNDEHDKVHVEESWIDEAGEAFKDALRRQLTDQGKNDFRLRMSNVGRPLCQLQMAAAGETPSRKPYNFKLQMLIGDAVESVTDVLLKIAGANITGSKDKVQLEVAGTVIRGEDDIEIDHRVFDIKTCSQWAFDNKWSQGYEHLRDNDDFGYVGQLIGYAKAKGKKPGGWIVICKSTGRIRVVLCDVSQSEQDAVSAKIEANVAAITTNAEFKRCFEPVEDKWRGKPTGDKRLCKTCEFCSYLGACWPEAEFRPHPRSEAKNPPHYWYVEGD